MDGKLMAMLAIIAGVIGVIGLHTLYLLAKESRNTFICFVYPIAFTVCLIMGINTVHELRGYPAYLYPTGKFLVYSHKIDGDTIFFWAIQDGAYRLHAIPATENNKTAMEKAAEAEGQGQKLQLQMDDSGEVEMELVDLSEIYPKED